MDGEESYAIAVIGGATAGAEAASIFSEQGILTVVFEQNSRPYGKIEDGLPRWHKGLREKEYRTIHKKLTQPHVHLVPETKVGCDLELRELTDRWGFHAVVLANGAWNDRRLPLPGADAYVDRGLVYQNPFIYWFNHYHEPGYVGPQHDVVEGTIVVGGGLASIDVVKVVQLELTLRALRERGIETDLLALETQGIPKLLDSHGLSWPALGIQGCTLYYRRRAEDMPLVEAPEGIDPARRAKIEKARIRVLEKARSKYLFGVETLHAPVELITEGERLAGLVFARTQVVDGRAQLTDQKLEVRAPLVISSIGSVPQPIEGIPTRGELYDFNDWDMGRLDDLPTVFGAGNVVTGKGNIVASRKHARQVAAHMTEHYLKLADTVQRLEPLTKAMRTSIYQRVRERQERVGYDGNLAAWIRSRTPSGSD